MVALVQTSFIFRRHFGAAPSRKRIAHLVVGDGAGPLLRHVSVQRLPIRLEATLNRAGGVR